jgi:hypothetical protein
MALAPSAGAATTCPSTFQVLHHDQIGTLQLPAGAYRVQVSGSVTCASSTDLFAAFLRDYDGVLPQGWTYRVQGTGKAQFSRRGTNQAFSVNRTGSGGGGRHPVLNLACAGSYKVRDDDSIGRLPVPAGRYRLTRLSTLSPNCRRVSRLFTRFLANPNGVLPGRWFVLAQDGAFVKDSLSYGFRIEPLL